MGSGYGGTQVGPFGEQDLLQIGGAQNTFGVSGGSIGQDIVVETGVGQGAGGEIIATGFFEAPCTPGAYTFSLENGVAYLLDQYFPSPENYWSVNSATVNIVVPSFSFTVSGGPECTGACCEPDKRCQVKTEAECALASGTYQGDDVRCPPATGAVDCSRGACCRPDGTCVNMTTFVSCTGLDAACQEILCIVEDEEPALGNYQGDGTSCNSSPCAAPAVGACCIGEGTCLENKTEPECFIAGGSFQGNGITCFNATCRGACCMSDQQSCQENMNSVQCYDAGGNYQGDDTDCSGTDCTTGACCLSPDVCFEATALSCGFEHGRYHFDGTDCASTFCATCFDGGGAVQCPASELSKLVAFDAAGGDEFGRSVSLSGNVAIVGAPENDNAQGNDAGAAYIYGLQNLGCVDEVRLTASDGAGSDEFGTSVGISGNLVVIGAPGHNAAGSNAGAAYVFRHNGASWIEEPKLTANDATASDRFGMAVAISGSTIVVGAPLGDGQVPNSGAAYVFEYDGSDWVQRAKLSATDAVDAHGFGMSVSIKEDSTLVAVGATLTHDVGGGLAYVYQKPTAGWTDATESAKLRSSDVTVNWLKVPPSVSTRGDVVLVGVSWDDGPCTQSGFCGAALIFDKPPGGWAGVVQSTAKLAPCDFEAGDRFGSAVSLSSDATVALIGAIYGGNAAGVGGAAYAFSFDGVNWIEEAKFVPTDQVNNDQFGIAVAVDDGPAVIGAPRDNHVGSSAGSVYVFRGLEDCDETGSLDVCDLLNGVSEDFRLANDCCETDHGTGCNDAEIQDCVCLSDSYCCETEWDGICVSEVDSSGCHSCGVGNGIPWECENCPADLDGNGEVRVPDLIILLGAWGSCPGGCPSDLTGDCEVRVPDLVILLGAWGPCVERFASGGETCLSLEQALASVGFSSAGEFITWIRSASDGNVRVLARLLLWVQLNWPC